ncbi:UNVERIFIED_CONTAM: hypothetical protein FKN15_074920 [Acipenser sinensis]
MDRNALAELLQALESRRDAEERRREERYTALIERTNQHKIEKNLNRHKPGVKWPRACEKTAWDTVNPDVCFALARLSGKVEKKLDKFGDIIYTYGSKRFGVEKRKEKEQTIPVKCRRQQETAEEAMEKSRTKSEGGTQSLTTGHKR